MADFFDALAPRLHSLNAVLKELCEAIVASRGTEPIPYIGTITDDPVLGIRRRLARYVRSVPHNIDRFLNGNRPSPHSELLAWLAREFDYRFSIETPFHFDEETGEEADDALAFFSFETQGLFRFEQSKAVNCLNWFSAYTDLCESIRKNPKHKYQINQWGEIEDPNGKRLVTSPARYELAPPGAKGGGIPTRNSLRKCILRFINDPKVTAKEIANFHNQRYPKQKKATAEIVRSVKRHLMKRLCCDESNG